MRSNTNMDSVDGGAANHMHMPNLKHMLKPTLSPTHIPTLKHKPNSTPQTPL